jgi:hypothetical protein
MLQMVITMKPDGNFEITGPLQNKPLCKAMLAAGQELIDGFNGEQRAIIPVVAMPRIVPNNGG